MSLFGWVDRSDEIRGTLEDWGMRPDYIDPFLRSYAKPLSKGLERMERGFRSHSPATRLAVLSMGGYARLAVVSQAVEAYLHDLRSGRHVGSSLELAVWGILVQGAEVAQGIDFPLVAYVQKEHSKRFPGLIDRVFDRSWISADLDALE